MLQLELVMPLEGLAKLTGGHGRRVQPWYIGDGWQENKDKQPKTDCQFGLNPNYLVIKERSAPWIRSKFSGTNFRRSLSVDMWLPQSPWMAIHSLMDFFNGE
jgi:hypothetical protein